MAISGGTTSESGGAVNLTCSPDFLHISSTCQASAVTVSVTRAHNGYRVVVADNGVGIAGFQPEHLSHGLAGMRQRTRALGGSFHLRTAPAQGTRVEAFFPLH